MWYALIAANIAQAGLFFYKLNSLPPQVPLFYSHNQGEEQLGDLWMIALLPVLMNVLVIANSYLYRRFYSGNTFVKQVIFYTNVFLIVSFTGIFAKILFLIS